MWLQQDSSPQPVVNHLTNQAIKILKASKQKERIQCSTMYIMLKWKLQIEKIEDICSKLDNLSFVHFIFTLKIIKTLRWRNDIPICKKELFELKLLALIMTESGNDFCLIFVSILTNHPFFLPEIKQGKNVLFHVLGWKKTSTSLSHDAFSTALNHLPFPLLQALGVVHMNESRHSR